MKVKARDFLTEIRDKDYAIKRKVDELSELKSKYGISACLNSDERVKTSMTADKMTDLIADVMSLECEIDEMVDDLSEYKKKAKRYVSMLNENYSDILYRRYFLYESMTEVAFNTGKKKNNVKITTDRALCKLQEILDIEFLEPFEE